LDIRRAVNKDIPQIEELLYQVCKVHSDKRPDIFKPGSKKYTTEELTEIINNDDKPIYVAEEDGKILGYVFCILIQNGKGSLNDFKTLYIDDLCVSEKYRGQKTGSKLYKYVQDVAKQKGCYNITLNVWEGNDAAKKFYEKCGLHIQKSGMEQIL